MILFQRDWKEKGAAPDYETKNESFLRMAMMYEAMGVKNCVWPLALYDKDLVGINPHDPGLDAHYRRKIAVESKRNFIYFLREIARDPKGSVADPVMFEANRGSLAATWTFFNILVVTLIMIRQTGKTFWVQWLVTWLKELGLTNSEITYYAQNQTLIGRASENIKLMEAAMPPYLMMRDKRERANSEVMMTAVLGNSVKFYVANRSKALADILGRGMTAPICICDEFAYCANNRISLGVMLSAAQAARELARRKGEIYGTVYTTTTGKRDTDEGRYAYEHVMNSAVFDEGLFDCRDRAHLEEVVRKMSPKGRPHVNITLNHRQLDKDDDWLRNRLEDAAQDPDQDPVQIKADYLNEWPTGSTESPFTQEQLDEISASEMIKYFLSIEEPENYALRWYYSEEERTLRLQEPHILSIDPSEAVGQDGIGIVLRRVKTGEIAMAADINEALIQHFSRWLGTFLVKHEKVTLIVESKSSGRAILDYLLVFLPSVGIDPFKRIFNQVVQRAEEFPDRFEEIKGALSSPEVFLKYKKYFGFGTSASGTTSRTDLYSRTLMEATRYTASMVRDRKLILEFRGLEIRGGRVDHQAGQHDDIVIAALLSYWLMASGRNLYYYGIDPRDVLCENKIRMKVLEDTSPYDEYRNEHARADVERITKQMAETDDEFFARRLENELQFAISKLSESDQGLVSFDNIVKQIREARHQRVGRTNYDWRSVGTERLDENIQQYGELVYYS